MRILYKDEDGKRLMRKSFCAFIDILGFRQKIKENDMDFAYSYLKSLDTELEHIEEYYDLSNKKGYKSFELKIFTDNFVFGQPWFDEHGEVELGTLFYALSHIQLTFVKSNIFCRGGISLSNLIMDENIVFGPALVESYKIESEIAVFPRILLSDDVVKEVNSQIKFYGDKITSPQNQLFLVDVDGHHFLNYLYILVSDYDSEYHDIFIKNLTEELTLHKESILKNLKLHKNNYKILEKYAWCAKYHNYFCDNFILIPFSDIEISKLKIDLDNYSFGIQRII
jgi:hypothetical protein